MKTIAYKAEHLKEIVKWIRAYDSKDEHDITFAVEMKDEAYKIFCKLLKEAG